MDLTVEQFAEALILLGQSRKTGERDKRRAPRVTHRCRASITLGGQVGRGPQASVTVKDLSPRGICILHAEEFPRGSNFIISLPRRGSAPVHILCTVVHCRAVNKDMHTIGAEFTCILEADHLMTAPDVERNDVARVRASVLD